MHPHFVRNRRRRLASWLSIIGHVPEVDLVGIVGELPSHISTMAVAALVDDQIDWFIGH